MGTRNSEHEALISWLKYFDVEYIDDSLVERLSRLDINNHEQMVDAIQLAVIPEYQALNSVSKQSMIRILDRAVLANDEELRLFFERVAMPFHDTVKSETTLLKSIQELIHELHG